MLSNNSTNNINIGDVYSGCVKTHKKRKPRFLTKFSYLDKINQNFIYHSTQQQENILAHTLYFAIIIFIIILENVLALYMPPLRIPEQCISYLMKCYCKVSHLSHIPNSIKLIWCLIVQFAKSRLQILSIFQSNIEKTWLHRS